MNMLTRWNPFKQLSRLDPIADADDIFRGFGLRSLLRDADTTLDMRMDVSEDDKSYKIKVDVPGVKKNDIEVSINGNQVTINAVVKREAKKESDREIHSERYCGSAYRSFSLPTDVDESKSAAHYEEGVLMLTLPKKNNGSARKLTVQ